jgi:hypothetical protein
MQAELHGRLAAAAAIVCVLLSCNSQQKVPTKEQAVATAPVASAATPSEPAADAVPAGCKASGTTPVKLGNTVGSVLGFAGDATHLYYVSWQLYGSRGNLGKVRKDGGGADALASLALEPRALAMDDNDLYYSEGIRLMKLPKAGGTPATIAPQFSSLSIAMDAKYIYGVPCDYGPYDRLVRVGKTGGVNYELDVATRPESKTGPVGYNGVAVDGAGVYVTDSGRHQVLRFPLERGKPKPLASGQPKAFDLATDSTNIYFTLADKGQLMSVPKAGGAAKKLATGLVPKSRIAADAAGVVATFAGENESAASEIAMVPRDGGARKKLALVESQHSVEAVALDKDCVYWVDRKTGSGAVEFYAVARQ